MSRMRKKANELRRRAQHGGQEMMQHWGNWRTSRELLRGSFHFFIGFAGWALLQVIRISMELLGVVLFFVGSAVFGFEHWRRHLTCSGVEQEAGLAGKVSRFLTNYLYRDTEKYEYGNTTKSFWGLSTAWLICWLAEAPWIATATCLIFSLVDPMAKLGKRWPIRKFKHGRAQGKSIGGFLFGVFGGVIGMAGIVTCHFAGWPILPPDISVFSVCFILLAGVLTGASVELISGKWDNYFIPACSSLVMVLFYWFLVGG